ncbi:hypothetical protein ACOSQ4_007417 [Xanthoceras sorbifolium]
MRKDKGKEIAPETQLAGVEQLTRGELSVVRWSQPNEVINLDSAFLVNKDLLEYERETEVRKKEVRKLCDELEVANKEAQAYKDKLASKTKLKKKLAEEAKRCQTLRKEMEQKMNVSKAKYKNQIHGLKDQVERVTVDLEHANKMIE